MCESLGTWTSCKCIRRHYVNVRDKSLKSIIIDVDKCWPLISNNPSKVLPHEIPAFLYNVLLYRELEGITEVPGFLCSRIVCVKQGREKYFTEIWKKVKWLRKHRPLREIAFSPGRKMSHWTGETNIQELHVFCFVLNFDTPWRGADVLCNWQEF